MTLEELFTLERCNNAFYKLSENTSWKESVQRYKSNLLLNNLELIEDIINCTYKISETVKFTIYERGKIRRIESAAIRDKIVQKVLCENVLLPQIRKYLIYDNYACLKYRGTSFARKRIDVMLHKYIKQYGNDGYVIRVDIKKYFDNIDHEILKNMLRSKLDVPEDIMSLIFYFIDYPYKFNKGLKLGFEIHQILAVFYMYEVDNYAKIVLRTKFYGRYMDDIIIFSNNKDELHKLLDEIKKQLSKLKLEINEKKTGIFKMSKGFTFMQVKYLVIDSKIIKLPTRQKIVRIRRKLKKFRELYDLGKLSEIKIRNCYKSRIYSLMKECNRCYKSIKSLNMLYDKLFLIKEREEKKSRKKLINEIFEEEKELYEIFSTCRQ